MVNKIEDQKNTQILGLNDALMQLKKSDLDMIRKLHEIKGVSNLNKTDLADVLAKQIPIRLHHILSEWDVERYGILKKATEHAGVAVVGEDLNIEKAEYFMEWGILFPTSKDNPHILFMPKELLDVFSALDHRDLEQITRRNDEWILLTNGLLHYYGFMDIQLAIQKIKELTGQELPVDEYINVIAASMNYYLQIGLSVNGLYHLDAEDEINIIEEHKFRSELDYYPFTKKQLLKAGKAGYFDSTPQTTALIKFLKYYYNMAHEDADFIVQEVVQLIKNDHSLNEVMTYLESQMEFPNFEILENLTALVAEIHNHTRMWVLKGYFPHELSKKGVKPDFLPPVNVLNSPQLPQRPTGENIQDNASSEDKVVDLNSRRKIGRNDPCPCGSGKKYKKCCGE